MLTAMILVAVVAGLDLLPLPRPAPDPPSSDTTDGGLASGDDYTVAGALGEIPATALADRRATITTADLGRAAKLNGATIPATTSDGDAVARWAHAMASTAVSSPDRVATRSPRVPVPLPGSFGLARPDDLAAFEEEVGWSVLDLAAFADVEGLVDGRGNWLGAGRTTVGLQADAGVLADTRTGRIGDGPEGGPLAAAMDDASVVRPNGATLDQAVQADDPALLAVARALDDAEVVGATVAADPREIPLIDPDTPNPVGIDDVTSTTAEALGYGWSIDRDGRSHATVAISLADAGPEDVDAAIAAAWELRGDELDDGVAGLTAWAPVVDVTPGVSGDVVTLTLTPKPDTSPASETSMPSTTRAIDAMLTALLDAGELPFATTDLSTALQAPPLEPSAGPVDPVTQLGIDQSDILTGAGGGSTAAPIGWAGGFSGADVQLDIVAVHIRCDGGWLLHLDIEGVDALPPTACDGNVTTHDVATAGQTGTGTVHKVAAGPDKPGTWSVAVTAANGTGAAGSEATVADCAGMLGQDSPTTFVAFSCDVEPTATVAVPVDVSADAPLETRLQSVVSVFLSPAAVRTTSAYLRGPSPAQEQQGLSVAHDLEPDDLAGLAVRDTRAIISLAEGADLPSATTAVDTLLREIRASVFQFPGVEQLELTLDGNCAAFWRSIERDDGCRSITPATTTVDG